MFGIDGKRIVAGSVVAFVLLSAADTKAFASLAVAFAYLIMLAALLTAGPAAFGRVSALVTSEGK